MNSIPQAPNVWPAFRARAGIPLRLKVWQVAANFFEVHPIRAFVWSGIGRELDRASGYDLGDDLGQVSNPIVVGRAADIIRLIEHAISRRFHSGGDVDKQG